MLTWQQLEQFVKTAIRILKGRRRDQAAVFVAALCFSGGFALPRLIDGKWLASFQIALYAIGAIALIYGVVRIWRLVNPPDLPPVKDRASAIKGPMAFTEADGELFRKLGRESELARLLGLVLDDQVLMVAVRGASGAGKTSLLRAGLKHILGDRGTFHYWEAVPAEPEKGLLRAIQEKWPGGTTKPVTLTELINPSDALGRQSHVIVLDQFEQLRGNRKVFQLLRRIIRESKPPHRITWVIAFRREFSADWLDFISPEQENGVRSPQDVSLRLFTTEQSRQVIGQLINESDLKDSVEQSVIDNLVEAATVDGEVSPVDIGIGLLVLTELYERQSSQTITKRAYQFAGGAEGLLTQYISRCLEPFPKEDQEVILKAMLALRDPEENRQRLATGLTIDELAVEAGTNARALKLQLNRLADRDIRLLETETPPDGSALRYRLPHERLIPALYRLTGKLLAEVGQAKVKFQNAFQAWQTNDKHSRYLLSGKDLRLVQRYETQIPWGPDEQEKKSFLFRSKRRRRLDWIALAVTVLALIGAGFFALRQYVRVEYRRYLTEIGYPAELYDFQHRLKKLEMTEPLNLEQFTLLSSNSLEELTLKAARSSNSIAGLSSLSRCRKLKKLTLDLSNSHVRNLRPLAQIGGLKQLTLHLNESQVSDLQPLARLKGLTQLELVLSKSLVTDLQPLAKLKDLTLLSLVLNDSSVFDLRPLAQLKGPTQVSLVLTGSQVSDSQLLTQLKEPIKLSLVLLGSNQHSHLQQIAKINGIMELSLDLRDGPVPDLQPLVALHSMKQLSLNLSHSDVNLQPLTQLQQLTQLTLNLSYSRVRNWQSLGQLNGLTQLSLDLSHSDVNNLDPLAQLQQLTQLTLNLSHSDASNVLPLMHLDRLTQLTLELREVPLGDLQALAQFKRLTQLILDFRDSQLSDLQPLAQINGLTQLTLSLTGNQVKGLQSPNQLQRLHLRLFLHGNQVNSLELGRNLSLKMLSIEEATRAQRMSVQDIPSNLVELRF